MEQQPDKLVSGAYYVKSKVKNSSPYSSSIENANKLMDLVDQYLKKLEESKP
jgi:hypothetical protein